MDKKSRTYARRYAMQALYAFDLNPGEDFAAAEETEETGKPKGDAAEFAAGLIARVKEHREDIDAVLTNHLRKWSLAQMNVVDKTILRLGACELLFPTEEAIDAKVVINEAVEMAKVYGGDDSYRLVNGILDAISRSKETTK